MRSYRGAAVEARPLDDGRQLLLHTLTRPGAPQSIVASDVAADIVHNATEFRSLEQHVRAVGLRRDWSTEACAVLHAELEDLADKGFLVPRDALRSGPSVRPRSRISTLAIPSGNRPTLALRTLRGYLDGARRHGRRVESLLIDTSSDPEHSRAYRRGLEALSAHARDPLHYFGPQQVEDHAMRMAKAGIDPALVRFACADPMGTGQSYGAARNRVLLDTTDSLVLSVDDDVTAATAPSPASRPGIAIFTGDGPGYRNYDPHEYWFHNDRAEVLGSPAHDPIDLFGEHERYLGRDVRSTLAEYPPDDIDTGQLRDPLRLDAIAAGLAHLPITFFGLRGDAGMYAPTWHLLKTGESRERLLASETSYRRAITSRELTRCVGRPTLTDGRWYQGTMIGIDNRDPMPPTVPVMRYEDGVFRVAVHRSFPHAMCAHLPWTVLHERPAPTPWEPDMVWRTGGWTRMGELLVRAIMSAPLGAPDYAVDPASRMRAIGRHLRELGERPIDVFFEWVEDQTRRQKALYLEHLEHRLTQHDEQPTYWARDVMRHLDVLRRALCTPELFVPLELRERWPLDHARALTRTIVRRYGELLETWPALIDATRAGPRPSVRVQGD